MLGLLRLEQLEEIEELSATARELRAVIGSDEEELADAFVELINEEVLRRLKSPEGQRIRITDLEELPTMLSQRIDRITHGWMMEGWERGRAEGEAKGRAEGEKRLFLELFGTKFGDVPVGLRERVAAASKEELETWAKRLLHAASPEDVFKC